MKRLFLLLGVVLVCGAPLFAKRLAPKEVPPVVHNGFEYRADYKFGRLSMKGLVVIIDTETAKVRTVRIYTVKINPSREEDVQHVYFSAMELIDDQTLRITNEKGSVFDLNLTTRKVTRVKK